MGQTRWHPPGHQAPTQHRHHHQAAITIHCPLHKTIVYPATEDRRVHFVLLCLPESDNNKIFIGLYGSVERFPKLFGFSSIIVSLIYNQKFTRLSSSFKSTDLCLLSRILGQHQQDSRLEFVTEKFKASAALRPRLSQCTRRRQCDIGQTE